MPDVLLVQPPIRDFYLTAKRTIPYGLASIAAALVAQGFSVEILDALATSKSRPAALPAEMSDLEQFYGRPDLSPFALFNRFRHFGSSFETIGRKARSRGHGSWVSPRCSRRMRWRRSPLQPLSNPGTRGARSSWAATTRRRCRSTSWPRPR